MDVERELLAGQAVDPVHGVAVGGGGGSRELGASWDRHALAAQRARCAASAGGAGQRDPRSEDQDGRDRGRASARPPLTHRGHPALLLERQAPGLGVVLLLLATTRYYSA